MQHASRPAWGRICKTLVDQISMLSFHGEERVPALSSLVGPPPSPLSIHSPSLGKAAVGPGEIGLPVLVALRCMRRGIWHLHFAVAAPMSLVARPPVLSMFGISMRLVSTLAL